MNFKKIVLVAILAQTYSALAAGDWGGDLRFRAERIDEDAKDAQVRHRVRARLSYKGKADDYFDYGVQLASGSTDPVSTNQTLGSNFSKKEIMLDQAYLIFHCPVTGAELTGGKFTNPYMRPGQSQLVWDGDLTPEGVSLKKEFGGFTFAAHYWQTVERSNSSDSAIHAAQVAYKSTVGNWSLTPSLGYIDYSNLKGQSALDHTSSNRFWGNSSASNKYVNDYNLMNAGLSFENKEIGLLLYADYVANSEVSSSDTGYLVGASYGKNLSVDYNYRSLEKDAAVGAFSDSDFKGGGTDGKGHYFSVSNKLGEKSKVSLGHLMNKTAITNGKDYHRTQLDFLLKF